MVASSPPSPWCPMRRDDRHGPRRRRTRPPVPDPLATPAAAAPDFADGLMGGPDTWTVTGVAPGDALNLRAAPSARAKIRARFATGTRLANKGCVLRRGQRWCHVAPRDTGAPDGWVSGRYLREAAD